MATKDDQSTAPAPSKSQDVGQAEVQKQMDKINEQGFVGQKVDPRPNSAYSLESGPDSPPAVEDPDTRFAQQAPKKEK